jgi:hypothetical protein
VWKRNTIDSVHQPCMFWQSLKKLPLSVVLEDIDNGLTRVAIPMSSLACSWKFSVPLFLIR